MTVAALSIAGSDSGGGAGIQADLRTFSALGVFGTTAISAVTAQNTCGVHAVHPLPPELVVAQIEAVLDDIDIGAAKTGALASAEIVRAVARAFALRTLPLVVDPVMVAKGGASLLADAAVAAIRDVLLPLATLVTPNLPEAAQLLGTAPARDEGEMAEQGRALLAFGSAAVLMKGGHGAGSESADLLVRKDAPPVRLGAMRVATRNTHGTGCTLSAAITACLARGLVLEEAVVAAKAYLTRAVEGADTMGIGHGQGPVDHFHGWEGVR